MSGDVQPRKRKDKKKKKDELGIEEPRGTAAVFGEGDVFIHSYHEHGTGGHWCAKIIFFSLLAVLATLIGLIILENRGLSDLEANAVESRYSGVLEGWIEDTLDDDHHDEHTLELKHPISDEVLHEDEDAEHYGDDEDEHLDDEDDHNDDEDEHNDDEDEHNDDEDEHDDDEDEHDDDEDEHGDSQEDFDEENDNENVDDEEQNSEVNEDEIEEEDNADIAYSAYKQYDDHNSAENDESVEEDQAVKDDYDNEESDEERDNDDEENENVEISHNGEIDDDNEIWDKEEEQEEDDDEDDEVERIEQEISDEDILSSEVKEEEDEAGDDNDDSVEGDEEESDPQSTQVDDDDEPPVERITIPAAGKPYTEIEEETVQKTPDTLADEEEYERQQEELKKEREAQSSQGMWLKLLVGGALLAATHAVVRRATAPRDEPEEEHSIEEPLISERRMTLIPQTQETPEIIRPINRQEEIIKKTPTIVQSIPLPTLKPEEDKTINVTNKEIEEKHLKNEVDKELYSDEEEEDEIDEEEEEEVEEIIVKKPEVKETKTAPANKPAKPEEPPEEDEDVEIIDEEEIEEELEDEEEEEVEEEISDVDDSDLLNRLEAKYGRLPEPERPGKNKGGGNSIEDDWPGEPNDPYWSQQLDLAEEELRQGAWTSCEQRASAVELKGSARAQFVFAKCLDLMAEAKRDNRLLSKAITAYLQLLKMNERLSNKKLVDIAQRAINRIQFRGTYLNGEPVYRLLIRRFPDNVHYRNNLTVSFLMANRADLADTVLKETLKLWPNDRIALAHYGFVLKNQYNKLEESVIYLQKALDGDAGAANEPRFFYHLGDALLQLGRLQEAQEIHEKGAKLGHFLSPEQRSLYNVARLRSRPWWPIEATPYGKLVRDLENSWKEILKEGLAAKKLYEKEKEGLKERGEWSQLDVFVRGQEIPERCKRTPVTCSIVRQEPGARCRRGQIKFSSMEAGTHVRPHVGPTNCRLRMHLALSNTKDTFIRVGKVTRQWELGKVFIFDDSFEHEVWHNGTGSRLVLIVDVWHPDLTATERKTLPAI